MTIVATAPKTKVLSAVEAIRLYIEKWKEHDPGLRTREAGHK